MEIQAQILCNFRTFAIFAAISFHFLDFPRKKISFAIHRAQIFIYYSSHMLPLVGAEINDQNKLKVKLRVN